ncbi:MAG: RNA polymerase factor sigma-54 [Rikenellaceae bacterium]
MAFASQRQIQKMLQKLSPQQIQMIKLLELPAISLEQRIKQEIEENPVLESDAPEKEDSSDEQLSEPKEISVEEYLKEDETPAYKYHANNFSKDSEQRPMIVEGGRSLQEYMQEQLGYKNMSKRESSLAFFIIGSIDDDGYLRRELIALCDDIAFSLGIETSEEELEKVLGYVHQLEPVGVGARDLQESLLLQLGVSENFSKAKALAHKILANYFEEFTKKHYQKLISRLGVSEDDFRDAIEVITHLSPKPGYLFSEGGSEVMPYVVPDFILDYQNGELELRLNTYNVPEVKVNKRYVEMIREMAGSNGKNINEENREALQFVKNKLDSAKWFISAIEQRRDTLNFTMSEILEYQKEYFMDGDSSKLKPMILKDIADKTGLDVSTISRVVNSKYIQTHFGIIPLKQLFSEAMHTDSGEEVSSYEIKKILRECIDVEDKRKPLTDEVLMSILNSKGYQIARRTVAKYREMLGVPVARLRKEI